MAFVFVMILHMKIDWSMPHNDNDKGQNSTIDASLNIPKHNNKKKKHPQLSIRTLCQISVLPHHIVSPYHQQLSVYSYYWFFSPHHTRTCVAWTVCIKL